MHISNKKSSAQRGFSLLELLLMVGIIGVIAAISIPSIENLNNSAKAAATVRNAQSIVEIYSAGLAAGIVWSGSDRNSKIASVVEGDYPSDGSFQGVNFSLPGLTTEAQIATYPYIGYDSDGRLFLDKSGTQPLR